MLESLRKNLTTLADLAIIIASIFVFIAFITPKELTFESIQELRQNAALNLSYLGNARDDLDDNETVINSLEILISKLRSQLSEQGGALDLSEIQELDEEIENTSERLTVALSMNQPLSNEVTRLQKVVDSNFLEIESLQEKSAYTPYWAQEIRNNLDELITAVGIDGLVAGFSSLIFCLVCNRRRDWVRKFILFFR
jgi:hypothetical protein